MKKSNLPFYDFNSGSDVAKEAGVQRLFPQFTMVLFMLNSFDHFNEQRLCFDPGGNRIRPSRVR